MSKELGAQIKHYRNQQNMTQEELAKAVGVATITIRQYESGAREPNTSMLQKIADALTLGNSPYAFFSDSEKDKAIMYTLVQALNGKDFSDIPAYSPLNDNLRKMEYFLKQMNDEGQRVAVDRVQELTQIPKYQRPTEADDKTPTQK